MATITGAEYVEIVRRMLVDYDAAAQSDLFPNSLILKYLNAGQVKIVRDCRSDHFRHTVTSNFTAAAMNLTTDLVGDISATLVVSATDRRPLDIVDQVDMDRDKPNWASETGAYPQRLVVKKTYSGYTLLGSPVPSATITNGLELVGIRKPTVLAGSTETCELFPGSFYADLEPILLPAAAMTCLPHFEGGTKDDQWSKWTQLYTALVKDYSERMNSLFQKKTSYRN